MSRTVLKQTHEISGWGRVMLVAVVMATVPACSWLRATSQPDVTFPRLNTAREQFYYAANYDQNTLAQRGEKGVERMSRVIAAYQMVLDYFPADQIYAPLAQAAIGVCHFRIKDYRTAIRIFKQLEERYPNFPFVHAEAEFHIGRSYELLGDGAKAKFHYQRCIDTFGHSKNDQIKAFVALCSQYYIAPSVPPRTKK